MAAGSETAFIELFNFYAPRLLSYAKKWGVGDAAPDLVQEVMLKAWQNAPRYNPQIAGASTWLFTIARNSFIDAQRARQHFEALPDDAHFVADILPADDAIAIAEEEILVQQALAQLPPEQQKVIQAAFFNEQSHEEIAKSLALPLGTVKSRIRLAMRKIGSILEAVLDKKPKQRGTTLP